MIHKPRLDLVIALDCHHSQHDRQRTVSADFVTTRVNFAVCPSNLKVADLSQIASLPIEDGYVAALPFASFRPSTVSTFHHCLERNECSKQEKEKLLQRKPKSRYKCELYRDKRVKPGNDGIEIGKSNLGVECIGVLFCPTTPQVAYVASSIEIGKSNLGVECIGGWFCPTTPQLA